MLGVGKIIASMIMAILVILLYHGNSGSFRSMQNYQGVLFFSTMDGIASAFHGQLLTFPLERPIFIKEYKENLYGVFSYFIAKILSEIPGQIVFTTIYVCIIYFVIPYNTDSASKFFIYFGLTLLSQIAGNAMGYMMGSFTSNLVFAITLGPTLMIIFIVFGGFFGNTSSMTNAFYWIKYISPFNYTYRAFVLNQFTDFHFDEGVLNPIDTLNFQGYIWESAGSLLLVMLGFYIIASINLKLAGEYSKKKI